MSSDPNSEPGRQKSQPAQSSLSDGTLNPDHRGFWKSLKDRLWGYDFFISYHWASGGTYAVNLAQRLREKNYDVFLDRADYASGDDWKAIGESALRNTQRLVLIATREAVTISKPVEHEVSLFTTRNRQVISIVFGDKFEDLDRAQYLTLHRMPDSKLYIEDGKETLASGPSEKTVTELTRTQGVMRRRNLRALLVLVPAITVIVFAVFASVSWINALSSASTAKREQLAAETERNTANKQREKAQNELAHAQFALGRLPFDQNKVDEALLWWSKSCETANDPDWRASMRNLIGGWESHLPSTIPFDVGVAVVAYSPDGEVILTGGYDNKARLWKAKTCEPIGKPMVHSGYVETVAFHPKLSVVATGSFDNSARLWDASSGAPLGEALNHQGWVTQVAFSPNGKLLLTMCAGTVDDPGGRVQFWDGETGVPIGEPLCRNCGNVARFSEDGRFVGVGCTDYKTRIWSTETRKLVCETAAHEGVIYSLAFSPDCEKILTGSDDTTARLWDIRKNTELGKPMRHSAAVYSVAYSPNSNAILTGSNDGTAMLWDSQTCEHLKTFNHGFSVKVAEFQSDRTVLTAGYDKQVKLWDCRTERELGNAINCDSSINSISLSPDHQTIATATGQSAFGAGLPSERKGEIRIWKFSNRLPLIELLHDDSVSAVAFSGDGKSIVTGCTNGIAQLWNSQTGEKCGKAMSHRNAVNAVCFSPLGDMVVTGTGETSVPGATIEFWNAETGEPIQGKLKPIELGAPALAVSYKSDGGQLVSGGGDRLGVGGELRLWDLQSTSVKECSPWTTQPWRAVGAVSFSVSNQTILFASDDGIARLIDARTGQELKQFAGHEGEISAAAFRSDGKVIATGGADGTARLWDPQSAELRIGGFQHKGCVNAVAFSLDGLTLATGCDDFLLRLWDVTTGVLRTGSLRHDAAVNAVAFSPDGSCVATASNDRSVRIWCIASSAKFDAQHPGLLSSSIELRTAKMLNDRSEIQSLTHEEWLQKLKSPE